MTELARSIVKSMEDMFDGKPVGEPAEQPAETKAKAGPTLKEVFLQAMEQKPDVTKDLARHLRPDPIEDFLAELKRLGVM